MKPTPDEYLCPFNVVCVTLDDMKSALCDYYAQLIRKVDVESLVRNGQVDNLRGHLVNVPNMTTIKEDEVISRYHNLGLGELVVKKLTLPTNMVLYEQKALKRFLIVWQKGEVISLHDDWGVSI